jgi:adenylate cyclase
LAISLGVVMPVFAALIAMIAYFNISHPLIRIERGLTSVVNEMECNVEPRKRLKGHCFKYSPIWEINSMQRSYDRLKAGVASFARYVPVSVVQQLKESQSPAVLGVKEVEATVLFSHIQDFGELSEQIDHKQLIAMLEEYFDAMSELVESGDGTLADFIGDCVFAFWNAAIPVFDHRMVACETVLRQQEQLRKLRISWKERNLPELKQSIGLNCGLVLAGNVGSTTRFKYTLVGDNVNLASRVQSINKYYGTELMISESVWNDEKGTF